jgi:hypothetical protein
MDKRRMREKNEKKFMAKKINIEKEFLYKRYVIGKETASSIARELFLTHHTILKRLREYNIKIKDNRIGKKLNKEHIQKLSGCNNSMFGRFGKDHPAFGYRHTKKTLNKMRQTKMGNKNPAKRPEVKMKLINNHYNCRLSNNPAWRGGISFEPYPLGWNKTFKEQIRYRDGYKCQLCGCPEVECKVKLSIHHIDYNKNNLNMDNLISLCHNCHSKTGLNREYWINYFKTKGEVYAGSRDNQS